MKQLLVEHGSIVLDFKQAAQSLKESKQTISTKNGRLIVRNVPCTKLDKKNDNGRIYSAAMMRESIENSKGALAGRQLLCSAYDHPNGTHVPPIHASHLVINAFIKETPDGPYLFNDWEVLNTKNGQDLRELILAEVSLGTSIRGTGTVASSGQVSDYDYLATDVVGIPSSGTYTQAPNLGVSLELEMLETQQPSLATESLNSNHKSLKEQGMELINSYAEWNKQVKGLGKTKSSGGSATQDSRVSREYAITADGRIVGVWDYGMGKGGVIKGSSIKSTDRYQADKAVGLEESLVQEITTVSSITAGDTDTLSEPEEDADKDKEDEDEDVVTEAIDSISNMVSAKSSSEAISKAICSYEIRVCESAPKGRDFDRWVNFKNSVLGPIPARQEKQSLKTEHKTKDVLNMSDRAITEKYAQLEAEVTSLREAQNTAKRELKSAEDLLEAALNRLTTLESEFGNQTRAQICEGAKKKADAAAKAAAIEEQKRVVAKVTKLVTEIKRNEKAKLESVTKINEAGNKVGETAMALGEELVQQWKALYQVACAQRKIIEKLQHEKRKVVRNTKSFRERTLATANKGVVEKTTRPPGWK